MNRTRRPQQPEQNDLYEPKSVEELTKIPDFLSVPQCVSLIKNNEILICGGYGRNPCYSYHIHKKIYQLITTYPKEVDIDGHTVVLLPNSTSDYFTLLSFGGRKWDPLYHTLLMKYKSIWNEEKKIENNKSKKNKDISQISNNTFEFNQWKPLPGHYRFGESQEHDLWGARALIGGSQQNLLFISRYPNCMDVIDIQSFQYLKHHILSFLKRGKTWFHCFVSIEKEDGNQFILMSEGETIFLQYNEIHQTFSYQLLSMHEPFYNFHRYTFAYVGYHIFIFGGYNHSKQKSWNKSWSFNVKKKIWYKCSVQMPSTIEESSAAVITEEDCIHIIGGRINGSNQPYHYVLSEWPMNNEKIEAILEYWVRENKLKLGWIVEFNAITANYILNKKELENK